MKVSSILVNLKGNDILSIINDFVNIDGLNLEEVIVNNEICIKGSFKKFINIKFEGAINQIDIIDGKIIADFSRLKVYKLGMFRIIRSLALKVGFNFINKPGIYADKNKIEIDLKELLNDLKFIDFNIDNINVKEENVEVIVEDLNLNLGLLLNKNVETNEIEETEEIEEVEEARALDIQQETKAIEEKVFDEFEEEAIKNQRSRNDFYDKGRGKAKEKVKGNLSDNAKVYSDYLFIVPDLLALICRLLKDDRVPVKTKLAVSASIAYIVCPTDIIPSNIPLIGKIDDIAVLFFALNRIANDIPIEVIIENWSGKNEMILVLKNGLEYVSNFTGARNIDKIYNIIEELSVL